MKKYLINTSSYLKIVLKSLHSSKVSSNEEFQQLTTSIEEKVDKCDDKIEYLSNLLPHWKEAETLIGHENKWLINFIASTQEAEKMSSLEEQSLPLLDDICKESVKFHVHEQKLEEIKKTVSQLEKSYSVKFDQLNESLEKCFTMKSVLSEKLELCFKLNIQDLTKYCSLKSNFKEMISQRSLLVILLKILLFCVCFEIFRHNRQRLSTL